MLIWSGIQLKQKCCNCITFRFCRNVFFPCVIHLVWFSVWLFGIMFKKFLLLWNISGLTVSSRVAWECLMQSILFNLASNRNSFSVCQNFNNFLSYFYFVGLEGLFRRQSMYENNWIIVSIDMLMMKFPDKTSIHANISFL